ncbi:MAG: lactam utilization protein LamB, partial [bacterium]|nr:lactam utilization protein LamB [bacterium]
MGESFGIYTLGRDEDLMKHITAANVACGFHAGDPTVMASTIGAAKRHRVAVGAHPSLPDRQGFGRREMQLHPDELESLLTYQVGALNGFLDAEGMD